MLKFLLILIPGIIAFILCMVKSKYRMHITAGFIAFVIVLNVAYDAVYIKRIFELKDSVNQLVYQEDYLESGEYPDALIPLLVANKKVYVKDDFVNMWEATEKLHYDWVYTYFHFTNPTEFLKHYDAELIQDVSLNNNVINESKKGDFTFVGYANDMLRNACIFHPDVTKASNYFYHYVFYSEKCGPMSVYINSEGIADANELVFLWQNVSEDDMTEDFYLMTKDYYDKCFK